MRIRMTASIRGSLNGVTVDDLVEGQDYDTANTAMGERMGQAHIANYVAIEIDADGQPVIAPIVQPVDLVVPIAELKTKPRKE